MQIRDRKKPGQKSPQKSDLGTSWAPFGRVWGKFWEGFGGSWGFLGCFGSSFFSCLYLEWFSKVLLEASGLDFGPILMDFGGILGRFWKVLGRFGRNLRAFWVILGLCGLFWAVGVFWADLRKILVGAPCCNGIHFELKL